VSGCEDALLVASELATNAVLRAGADAEGEFELLAELIPDGIRIAVTDDGRAGGAGGAMPAPAVVGSTPAAAPTSAPGLSGGMGLWVVDALSRRWGTERDDITRVWAELAL
jgi:anti-sigma regulatory factor (Ser/Thr protein kinase)